VQLEVCGVSAKRPIGHDAAGKPRTYRLERDAARHAGYRRLAIAILGLDVETLARRLRADAGRVSWTRDGGRV
jgi:hypothetical protein